MTVCLLKCVLYVLFVTDFTDYGMDGMIYGMVIVEWLYLSMIDERLECVDLVDYFCPLCIG